MNILNNLFETTSKMSEKNRYLVLGGFLVVLFLVDYFLIMKTQLDALNVLNPKVTILDQDLKQARSNIAMKYYYESEIQRLGEEARKTDYEILPVEDPIILEGISRLASDNRIKIDQMVPYKSSQELLLTNKEGKFYSFPVLVEARGAYHDIGRFVDQLEKDKVFRSVSSFVISASPNDSSHHSVRLTIKTIVLEKAEGKTKS